MESVIIEEMRAFLRLGLPERQRKYFADTIDVAKRVEVVPAADVFNEREIVDTPGCSPGGQRMLPQCAFVDVVISRPGAIRRG
mgnify:CR=1 FL=1